MSDNAPNRRWPTLVWLILSQLFYLGLLIPWSVVSMMSIMAFDSGTSPQAVLFVGAVWSYPIWPLIFSILAWVAYARRNDRLAAVWTSIPLGLVILAVTILLVLAELGF
ncbi:MAG: hypothetical protein CVU44_04020 [Chloroflexi bacterium HGW-Chloroflexi-6]|nr:MAG: hypothetical protein CVU44_04020 [Chloroflexi bacterium HGW-Chloroflexi-6]